VETILLDPTQVKVNTRVREDFGDLQALSDSIAKHGNILPVIINRNNELIDGGRRLAAATLAHKPVLCVYYDTVDPVKMKELELEANLHRKDFTANERSKAVLELHSLMQSQYGISSCGASGGWTLQDTANKIGVSIAKVAEEIKIAKIIEDFPELANVEKKSDIKKAVKAINKLQHAVSGIKAYEEILATTENPFTLYQGDSLDYMTTIPSDSIDILLTDPLYGIEHDKLMIGAGGKTGGQSSTHYKFDDSTEPALRVYDFLAQESYRFTNSTAHVYIFLGAEHFTAVRNFFCNAGFNCYVKPIIWIKRTTGSCNAPTHWPSDCYEVILYARKEASRLVKEGMPNWIEVPPVLLSEKVHQYEKPVKLLDNLLQRSALPGQKLYDPFMGSGASIEAAIHRNMTAIGGDLSQEAYAFAAKRMVEVMERKRAA